MQRHVENCEFKDRSTDESGNRHVVVQSCGYSFIAGIIPRCSSRGEAMLASPYLFQPSYSHNVIHWVPLTVP